MDLSPSGHPARNGRNGKRTREMICAWGGNFNRYDHLQAGGNWDLEQANAGYTVSFFISPK